MVVRRDPGTRARPRRHGVGHSGSRQHDGHGQQIRQQVPRLTRNRDTPSAWAAATYSRSRRLRTSPRTILAMAAHPVSEMPRITGTIPGPQAPARPQPEGSPGRPAHVDAHRGDCVRRPPVERAQDAADQPKDEEITRRQAPRQRYAQPATIRQPRSRPRLSVPSGCPGRKGEGRSLSDPARCRGVGSKG